jgi:hypothetical protein
MNVWAGDAHSGADIAGLDERTKWEFEYAKLEEQSVWV